ncbi:MAG: DUF2318 domain-containing protein [Desulfobacteraceae bacterium]|nr:DUF2318 domain-containing protein [Desulfobacteraceae bacterium]
MTNTNKSKPDYKSKRDLVLKKSKSNTKTVIFAGFGIILVLGALIVVWSATGIDPFKPVKEAFSGKQNTKTTASAVSHDVDLFNDGKARHYEYQANNITVRYFIIKSSDGILRAAFDACDVCWRAGKGYFQQGDDMVCRNCGRNFPSNLINEKKGGCNPAPLQREIKDKQLIIQVADILEGQNYFNL